MDVGYSIDVYSDFECLGKRYQDFPSSRQKRILLPQLRDKIVRDFLRAIWLDPFSLDPSRRAAQVTREVAASLARLARNLEEQGKDSRIVADFLMRCLFTMFAEDVGLLPQNCFTDLLEELKDRPPHLASMLETLWKDMDQGGFSTVTKNKVLRFNGHFFKDASAIVLNENQINLLIAAARADWKEVEPAIFGTLLERALDPRERHKLGAHFTPRAYVERLVYHTIEKPLRSEWEGVRALAMSLDMEATAGNGKQDPKRAKAIRGIQEFHHRLCTVQVLDPACGTGNFLYVTMEKLKKLEGETLQALAELDAKQELIELETMSVSPKQFLGIEINERAAAIAELVLWLGFLQMHFETHGQVNPPEPVMQEFHNIQNRNAVLAFDKEELVLDKDGKAVRVWDGYSTKKHPVTGNEVPDETRTTVVYRYLNPRPAEWPEADFIVGNPPFIGTWKMRGELGQGYAETIRTVYSELPDSCDFVMYWWELAARRLRRKPDKRKKTQISLQRFGFITTSSIYQTFNRRVMQPHVTADDGLSLGFAIPDHPWVDSADGAAVRIAMTMAIPGQGLPGWLGTVVREAEGEAEECSVTLKLEQGMIHSDLTIGVDVTGVHALLANDKLCSPGVKLHGAGFIVTEEEAKELGLGRIPGLERHIRHYRNGRDMTSRPRGVMVIDLYGLSEEEVRAAYPEVYQWVYERVRPERLQNNEKSRRENWWLFGRKHTELRSFIADIPRYISTVETAKHRVFTFLDKDILPDNKLINIGLDDSFFLGVLSSRLHTTWALAAGAQRGVTPVYVKTRCFDPFPFPNCSDEQKQTIRQLADELDRHRKERLRLHPELSITEMYNVLEKGRSGESLTDKENQIHSNALLSVLHSLHDELDKAVADAYGWSEALTDQEILAHVVALNSQRAAEEEDGMIRWLRPAFQAPAHGFQSAMLPEDTPVASRQVSIAKADWPRQEKERLIAIRSLLEEVNSPVRAVDVARSFRRAQVKKVEESLALLASVGGARVLDDGRYAA